MTPSNFTEWRDLLAFGLSTAETNGVELWAIQVSGGDRLSLHLAGDDPDEARRVAEALGVEEPDAIEHRSEKTFFIASRGPAPFYYKDPEPYPYAGPSVRFGERLVEVSVACGLPAEDEPVADDDPS